MFMHFWKKTGCSGWVGGVFTAMNKRAKILPLPLIKWTHSLFFPVGDTHFSPLLNETTACFVSYAKKDSAAYVKKGAKKFGR